MNDKKQIDGITPDEIDFPQNTFGTTTPDFVAPGLYNPLHFYPLPPEAVKDLDHKDIVRVYG